MFFSARGTAEIVRKTKVVQLLKALPGYGPVKVDDLLEQPQTPRQPQGRRTGLGQRQRQALLDALS